MHEARSLFLSPAALCRCKQPVYASPPDGICHEQESSCIDAALICPQHTFVSCRYKGCYREATFDGVACSSLEQSCFSCYCSIAIQTFAGFSYCKRYWLKYIIQVKGVLCLQLMSVTSLFAQNCLHVPAEAITSKKPVDIRYHVLQHSVTQDLDSIALLRVLYYGALCSPLFCDWVCCIIIECCILYLPSQQ